jgi:hypothetical protein
MAHDRVIYTDGRDVVVTDSMLKVKNASYRLNGITKFYFWTIKPERWPGILLLLLGLTAAVCGFMNVLPPDMNMHTDSGLVTANSIAWWGGLVMTLLGIFALIVSKERYAVRIGTAEGERNAVVSTSRDYISQIVDAIHSAFDIGHNPPVFVKK